MADESLDLSEKTVTLDELLSPAEVAELKKTCSEFVAVKIAPGVAAFRAPTRAEYARYQQMLFDEKTRAQSFSALVLTTVILPDKDTFSRWLDKYPGIATTCVDAVNKLAGVDTEAQTKKY